MSTFTVSQYQQVQQIQTQLVVLAQDPTFWSQPAIQTALAAAYNSLNTIASYIAAEGTN